MQKAQLLFCGFCEVPGVSAAGARLHQQIAAISDDFGVDALAVREDGAAHIERVGNARLMRVPVPTDLGEAIAAFQRAVRRQLQADPYQLVYCGDVFACHAAAAMRERQNFRIVLEVNDLPSSSFHRRFPVGQRDKGTRRKWQATEKAAFRAADRVVVSSRETGRVLSEFVDPRNIELIPRGVDLDLFAPPTVQVGFDSRKTIAVFGGLEGRETTRLGRELAAQLASSVDPKAVRVCWIGKLSGGVSVPNSVEVVAVDGPARVATALTEATVVVVPTAADGGADLYGVPHRVLEAMACGRPVVVSGGARVVDGLFEDQSDLIIAPPGSPAEVIELSTALVDDERRRVRIGRNARHATEERAGLDAPFARFASLVEDLIGEAPRMAAAGGNSPYEATTLQVPKDITVDLPPPLVMEVRTCDLVDGSIENSPLEEDSLKEDRYAARLTEIDTGSGSNPAATRLITSSTMSSGPGGTEIQSLPIGARSLGIDARDLEGNSSMSATWSAAADTEIYERGDDAPNLSDTGPNRTSEERVSTMAALEAVEAELEAEKGSDPWDNFAADTIADAAPLVDTSQKKQPVTRRTPLLADPRDHPDPTVENVTAVSEETSNKSDEAQSQDSG